MQLYLHPTRPEALTLNDEMTMLTRWSLTTNPAKQLTQRATLPGKASILPIGQKIIRGGITDAPDGELFAHAHCSSANISGADLLELHYWQDLSLARILTIPGSARRRRNMHTEVFEPIETPLGILSGRDAIFLDGTQCDTPSLILLGAFSGSLASI